jgi:HK97 family phage portal protein
MISGNGGNAFGDNGSNLKIYNGMGGGGGGRSFALLPGAKHDWELEAGRLYLNDVVSIACNWIAEKVNLCPLVVEERQGDGTWAPAYDTGLAELWVKSNDNYDSFTRDLAMALSVITSGNAFLYIERDAFAGLPIGLHWLDERYVFPLYPATGERYLDYWRYMVNGRTLNIPKEDVLHFRWGIDPLNTRLGLSKLKAVLRQICLLNEAAGYSVSILKNGGVPGLIITPEDSNDELLDDEGGEIESQVNRMTRGDNRGRTISLNRRIKIDTIGFSPEQMALDKLPNGAMPMVLAAIGTSPEVHGLPSATKTYDNFGVAIQAAWRSGVLPILGLIRSTISRRLMPEFGLDPRKYRVVHDLSQIPDLAENLNDRHKRARDNFTAGGISLNEFRAELGKAPDPFGDRYFWEINQPGTQPAVIDHAN